MKELDTHRIPQEKQRSRNKKNKCMLKYFKQFSTKHFFPLGCTCTVVPFHTKVGTPSMSRFQKHGDMLLSYAQLFTKDELHEQI